MFGLCGVVDQKCAGIAWIFGQFDRAAGFNKGGMRRKRQMGFSSVGWRLGKKGRLYFLYS